MDFPRTMVGGVSLPRLIIGTNWFLGYSHTSLAKDKFIKELQTRQRITTIITAFVERGVDAIMAPVSPMLEQAIEDAEQKTGRGVIRILTPWFDTTPGGETGVSPEAAMDQCKRLRATFCFPHQATTDALTDRMTGEIRNIQMYTRMIRERGMIPGLSTHMPEAVIYADKTEVDVESYIQIYNAAGFLMQVEADWVMRVIQNAKKPVMTIKPLAAGRLLPVVGFAFVWNTIRVQDMVTIGTTTADEAKECIDISLDLLAHQNPDYELQKTRSKKSLG
jgi:hypothetical protein